MTKKRLVTPVFRVSFPQVFEAKAFNDGDKPKYSVQMVWPKGTDLSTIEDLVQETAKDFWGEKVPKNMRNPLRDGNTDREGQGIYIDATFANAASQFKPGLVDADVQPIIDQAEFYPGCYARATVTAYAYDNKGNRGVALGLQNLQKVKDGDRLDGAVSAESEFQAIADSNATSGDFAL